jgi:hypothetical protein
MTPFREFANLRPIELDLVHAVIQDVLLSDFGMESDWAMNARDQFLAAREIDRIGDIPVTLHPAELTALQEWLRSEPRQVGSPHDRRLRRLAARAADASIAHRGHPWFKGVRLNGSNHPALPAWFDGVMLHPFNGYPGDQPVILRPTTTRAAHGMNVTWFTIEEVE